MVVIPVCALDRLGLPDITDVQWEIIDATSVRIVQVVLISDLRDPDRPHHTPIVNLIDGNGRLLTSPGLCSLWFPDAEASGEALASEFGMTLGRHYVRTGFRRCWR